MTTSTKPYDRVDNQETDREERAIMQAAQRDPHLFAPLYERYFQRIYRYCLRRVDTPQEAEDLTSLIFTRALKGLDSYRGGMVAAWLFRIAHNTVANHMRRNRPQVSIEGAELDLPTDSPEPIMQVIDAERAAIVRDLIADLPDYQQDLLALKLTGELTSQEIGDALGKSAGAVRVDLHRIVTRLRDQIQDRFRQASMSDKD